MPPDIATRHVVIRASAGAGKTYQLVNHYLRLLHGGADPAGLLATTFTRKAAREILATIVERLIVAVGNDAKRRELGDVLGAPALTVPDCHKLIGSLVSSLHRLSVGTIDSFFHRVASAFRWELDLPPDPIMAAAQSPDVTALRQEVISEVLAGDIAQDLSQLFLHLHRGRAARSVGRAFDTLVLKLHDIWRLAPDRALWDQLEIPASLSDSELAQAIDNLAGMVPQLPVTAAGQPNKTWEKAFESALNAAREGRWEDFLGNGLVGRLHDEDGGERMFARKEITQAWFNAFSPLVRHASSLILEQVRQRHLASFKLLSRYDEVYHRLRRGRRLLMFSDLTWKLARQLPDLLRGELPRVHHRLDVGIDHLLLDEFQDTSPSQWQVLEPFADKVTTPESEDESLFVVGDMKQAIYGWRGGNAALFADVERRYEIPAEDLATSYRSVPVIIDLVNAVFGTLGSNQGFRDDPADRGAAQRFEAGFDTPKDAKRFIYPGNPDPLTFGECGGERGAVIEVAETGEVTFERRPVSVSSVHDVGLDVTGCHSSNEIRERLRSQMGDLSGYVRVTVSGDLDADVVLHLGDLADLDVSLEALVVRQGRIRPAYELETIAAERTVRGQFVRDVQAAALDEEDRERILTIGLRALDQRDDLEVV